MPAPAVPAQRVPLRRRAGAGKAPRRVRSPPRPTAAPLESSAFSFSSFIFFSHPDFTCHPRTRPRTPLYPCIQPGVYQHESSIPSTSNYSRRRRFTTKIPHICNNLGKLNEYTPYTNAAALQTGTLKGGVAVLFPGAANGDRWLQPLLFAQTGWHRALQPDVDRGVAERAWIYLLAAKTYSSEDLLKPNEWSYAKFEAREKHRLSTSRLSQLLCFSRSTPGHPSRLRQLLSS